MSTILARLAVSIDANTAAFGKGIAGARKDLTSFTNSITDMAKTIGLAFGVQQVASFTIEVSKLAGEFDSVKTAFDRLKNSRQLMEDLKKATNDTVSELDLMKRAVQASNFDISLKALPKLLEFATLRAQQTGQSVNYLVDSIVTGIGRKSKLILDNLGISAVQLEQALGGASTAASSIGEVADAVGRIAEQNLKNMAGFADNAKSSFDQLAASWENFKVSLGQAFNEAGGASLTKDVARIMDVLSSKTLAWTQKVQILVTTWDNAGISEKLDEWNKKMQPIIERQELMNKWDAQLLINKYGGINQAIEGLNKLTQFEAALNKEATRQLENKADIMTILFQRQKEFNDAVVRGEEAAAKEAARLAKELEHARQVAIELAKLRKQIEKPNEKISTVGGIDAMPQQMGSVNVNQFRGDLDNIMNYYEGINVLTEKFIDRWHLNSEEIMTINQSLVHSFKTLGLSIFESAANAIRGEEKFGVGILKALANFGKQFGAQLIAIGVGKVAMGIMERNPVTVKEGLAGIAAGGALVGASTALSGHLTRQDQLASMNSSGGGGGAVGLTQNTINVNVNGKLYGEGKSIVAVINSTQQSNYQLKG